MKYSKMMNEMDYSASKRGRKSREIIARGIMFIWLGLFLFSLALVMANVLAFEASEIVI